MFYVCCVLCRYRPLWRADHWFRGVPLCVCTRALVCLIVCDLEISIMRQPKIELDFCVTKISNGVFVVCYNKFDGYTPLEIWNYKQLHLNLIYGSHLGIDIDSILVPTALYYFHVEWDLKCQVERRGMNCRKRRRHLWASTYLIVGGERGKALSSTLKRPDIFVRILAF
jgi:hypothetical protein